MHNTHSVERMRNLPRLLAPGTLSRLSYKTGVTQHLQAFVSWQSYGLCGWRAPDAVSGNLLKLQAVGSGEVDLFYVESVYVSQVWCVLKLWDK